MENEIERHVKYDRLYLCSASIATGVMQAEVYTLVCVYTLRVRMRLVVATRYLFGLSSPRGVGDEFVWCVICEEMPLNSEFFVQTCANHGYGVTV